MFKKQDEKPILTRTPSTLNIHKRNQDSLEKQPSKTVPDFLPRPKSRYEMKRDETKKAAHDSVISSYQEILNLKEEFLKEVERLKTEIGRKREAPEKKLEQATVSSIKKFGEPVNSVEEISVLQRSSSNTVSTESALSEVKHNVYDDINSIGYEGEFYLGKTLKTPRPIKHINVIQSASSWGGLRFFLEIDNDSVVEFKTPAFVYNKNMSASDFSSEILKKNRNGAEMLSSVGEAYNTSFELTPELTQKIYSRLFDSREFDVFKRKDDLIQGVSDQRIIEKTNRIKTDINRWNSGVNFIRFINSADNNISEIANNLTSNMTGHESRTVQVNRGVPYRTMINTIESESGSWSSSVGTVNAMMDIAKRINKISFKGRTLYNYYNSYRGFLFHCALSLAELEYKVDDKKKNIGFMIHPKTSPEDGFAMLPHLPESDFDELKTVIRKTFPSKKTHNVEQLIDNLSVIHSIRQSNNGVPVEMERDKRKYQKDILHTMHRPDTRIPVPVRKNENNILEVGTVLELRDTKAPVNKVIVLK